MSTNVGFLKGHISSHEPFVLSSGATALVPKYEPTFKKWGGPLLNNTFGGKAVLDVSGSPAFAELAIAELFRRAGFSARWAETYGRGSRLPKFMLSWNDTSYGEQDDCPIGECWVMDALRRIAELNGGSYSGCWDVIAWKGDRLVFAESKRSKKDRIRDSQRHWLEAGLKSGLAPGNFLVVEWDTIN